MDDYLSRVNNKRAASGRPQLFDTTSYTLRRGNPNWPSERQSRNAAHWIGKIREDFLNRDQEPNHGQE